MWELVWLASCHSSVVENWQPKPGILSLTPGHCYCFHVPLLLSHNIQKVFSVLIPKSSAWSLILCVLYSGKFSRFSRPTTKTWKYLLPHHPWYPWQPKIINTTQYPYNICNQPTSASFPLLLPNTHIPSSQKLMVMRGRWLFSTILSSRCIGTSPSYWSFLNTWRPFLMPQMVCTIVSAIINNCVCFIFLGSSFFYHEYYKLMILRPLYPLRSYIGNFHLFKCPIVSVFWECF